MLRTARAISTALILLSLSLGARALPAAGYDKNAVSGWTIVGVWKQNYGIDLYNVIERSEKDEYRLRYVTSKDPRSVEKPKPLQKTGNRYSVEGSGFGDYFVIEGTELKTYDNEGYIDTLKPARTS